MDDYTFWRYLLSEVLLFIFYHITILKVGKTLSEGRCNATQLSSEKSKSKHVIIEDEKMKTQLESASGLIEKVPMMKPSEKLLHFLSASDVIVDFECSNNEAHNFQ
ncbi:unnamed protein product [Lactuca saligna]|uniref:Uncharacterized protein n=1 Tax=Lactuca saligna TaxID=75948 RepID=A0AA35V2V0_LACSI|nr:unnamed protein product [Lactuca saligna]